MKQRAFIPHFSFRLTLVDLLLLPPNSTCLRLVLYFACFDYDVEPIIAD